MARTRLIARLDVKGPNLIKGIHLEGLRVMGDPGKFSLDYYRQGIDEIIYVDAVASLYGRNHLAEVIRGTAKNIFIPITVGGGIRSIDDVKALLRCGADKVAINTWAVKNPQILKDISRRFGSSCTVLSIEAKMQAPGKWEAYTDNGRERTGLDVVQWAEQAVSMGVGEILLTSVDQEGTRKGFDVELIRAVSSRVSVPVIASGGMGELSHVVDAVKSGGADAVAIADALHYKRMTVQEIRDFALKSGLDVRKYSPQEIF